MTGTSRSKKHQSYWYSFARPETLSSTFNHSSWTENTAS